MRFEGWRLCRGFLGVCLLLMMAVVVVLSVLT
jgi:hypothetical protein